MIPVQGKKKNEKKKQRKERKKQKEGVQAQSNYSTQKPEEGRLPRPSSQLIDIGSRRRDGYRHSADTAGRGCVGAHPKAREDRQVTHNVTTTPRPRSSRTARSKWRQQLRQATTDATVQIWLETPAPTLFNNDGLCRAAALGDGPAEDLHQVAEHETRGPQPRGQGPRPGPARWRTCSPASLRSLSRPSSPAWPRPAS